MASKITQDEFIKIAKETHEGQDLDYSQVLFTKMKGEVCIICHKKDVDGNEHGPFWQRAGNHVRLRQGCPKCGREHRGLALRVPFYKQIERAKKIHGDKYKYPDLEWVRNNVPIPITCPIHGVFNMDLNAHIDSKQGCPLCAVERRKSKKYGIGINDMLFAEK